MSDHDRPEDVKTNPDPADTGQACEPGQARSGPVREAGGTTGAGNLSPDQASRTGGATGGLADAAPPVPEARRGLEPDA